MTGILPTEDTQGQSNRKKEKGSATPRNHPAHDEATQTPDKDASSNAAIHPIRRKKSLPSCFTADTETLTNNSSIMTTREANDENSCLTSAASAAMS